MIARFRREFNELQHVFLARSPVPIPAENGTSYFSIQSNRKQLRAAARRFALTQQTRGLHIYHRECSNKPQHFEMAKHLKHPAMVMSEVLEAVERVLGPEHPHALVLVRLTGSRREG